MDSYRRGRAVFARNIFLPNALEIVPTPVHFTAYLEPLTPMALPGDEIFYGEALYDQGKCTIIKQVSDTKTKGTCFYLNYCILILSKQYSTIQIGLILFYFF